MRREEHQGTWLLQKCQIDQPDDAFVICASRMGGVAENDRFNCGRYDHATPGKRSGGLAGEETRREIAMMARLWALLFMLRGSSFLLFPESELLGAFLIRHGVYARFRQKSNALRGLAT